MKIHENRPARHGIADIHGGDHSSLPGNLINPVSGDKPPFFCINPVDLGTGGWILFAVRGIFRSLYWYQWR